MICYRIHFEAHRAQWVIQLQDYWFWGLIPKGWQTVTQGATEDGRIAFASFKQACDYTTEIGLNQQYRQLGLRVWDRILAGGVC